MNKSYSAYLDTIEKGLVSIELNNEPEKLYDPIKYILVLGGKRVRPILALIGADLFRGEKSVALNVALSIELFHNFTLIHDDIMDEAPLRRGKATVHKKWNQSVAILSGDAMLIKAYDLLANSGSDKLAPLLTVFNDTAFKVCEGQQYDMDFEQEEFVQLESYLQMIKYKTSVLLGAALQMGAITSGASSTQCDLLYQFGLNVGMAFQLKDDWLDVYGDPEKFGKTRGGDILASKKTFLMIKAFEEADDSTKNQLIQLLSLHPEKDKEAKLEGVIAIYNHLKVGEALKVKMNEYYEKAMDLSKQIKGDEKVMSELLELTRSLMDRDQ